MADETTQTPQDTATSATNEVATPAVVEGAPAVSDPAPAADDASEDAGTVLGGKDEGEGEAEAAEAGPPEKYELALEGVDLDPEALTQAEPVLRDLKLSNDAANKLVPVAASLVERTQQRTMQQLADAGAAQRKAWLDEAKGSEDIGGGKWDAALHSAAKGLDAMGIGEGHTFRKLLNDTGFGNHPDMIRVTAKLGELLGESQEFLRGDAAAKVEVPTEQRWYGKKEA